MEMRDALTAAGVLRAEEVVMLNQLFHDMASDPYYTGNKQAREQLAADILHHFKSGMTDIGILKSLCKRTPSS